MEPQIFKLSLKPDDHPPRVPVVYANQYDVGRPFAAEIYDVDGSAYTFTDETVTVCGTKPSGTGFSYDATCSGNTVSFSTTGQMTVVHGFVRCGIIITKGDVVVGSLAFLLYVQQAPLTAETIVDSDDFGDLISAAVIDTMFPDLSAVATQAPDSSGDLSLLLRPIYSSGYLLEDGTIHTGQTYITTNLIEIPAGYQLRFTAYMASGGFYWCEYDEDGKYLATGRKGLGAARSGIKIDAIEPRWVRLSTRITDVPADAMDIRLIPLGAEPITIDETSNIYHYSQDDTSHAVVAFSNQYVNTSGAVTSLTGYRLSGIIYLQKGQTISFKAAGSSSVYILSEWTFNTSFIQGLIPGDLKYHRITYTADHDMWVRVCSRVQPTIGTSTGAPYVPSAEFEASIRLFYSALRYAKSKLRGKTVLVIGDSLVYGYTLGPGASWCRVLELATGATVLNYGINGNAISSISGASGTPMSQRINTTDIPEIATADIVILEGGANDKNRNCPLGTISDLDTSSTTSATTTFYGAVNKTIDDIRALNPKAVILYMTTYHRADNVNSLGLSYQDYADAMLAACRARAVPCIDNYGESGILFTNGNLAAWCDEGLYLGIAQNNHFSPAAFEYLTPLYRCEIEKRAEATA